MMIHARKYIFLFFACVFFFSSGVALSRDTKKHGTGLLVDPPERLQRLRHISLQETAARIGPLGAPTSVDLSSHMPPIGDQGMIGSCTSWSLGYYFKCYQENKDSDWALEAGGWTLDELCSPAFIYNQINNGENQGTSIVDGLDVLERMGMTSWSNMPFAPSPFEFYEEDEVDFKSLPSKSDYLDAMPYRIDSYEVVSEDYPGDSEIIAIKNILASGQLVTFGMMVANETGGGNFFDYDSSNHCLDTEILTLGGHALTIVGYDDNFNGAAHGCPGATTGAFKVINSWGSEWGANGYFWMTYFGAKLNMMYAVTMTDREDYTPKVVAEVDITHSDRGFLDLTFYAGSYSYVFFGDGALEYYYDFHDYRENINMWVDLTDFYDLGLYPPETGVTTWKLKVYNDSSSTGTIDTFLLDYNGRETHSYDTPVSLSTYSTKYSYISALAAISISPSSAPPVGTIDITSLTGKSFDDTMDVRLVRSGESDIVASDVSVVSNKKIKCSFDLTGATIGTWDLSVTNATDNLTYTLSDAFEVEAIEFTKYITIPAGWSLLGSQRQSTGALFLYPQYTLPPGGKYEIYRFDGENMECITDTSSIELYDMDGVGYWIYSENGVENAGLYDPPPTNLPPLPEEYFFLHAGWNLFLPRSLTWSSATLKCSGVDVDLPGIYSYDSTTGEYVEIEPGSGEASDNGLWIKVDEECILTINYYY